MVLGSKKKKEEGRKLTDLLNELIGIEIDNRKLQDENQKKIGEMYDNIAKLVEEHREANEQILDGLGRLEGAMKNMGTIEAQVLEAPVEEETEAEEEAETEEEAPAEEEEKEEEAPAEEEVEEEASAEEEAEEEKEEEAEAPAEEEKETKEDDVLRRLRQLREKGG